jgi:hypothetical protein
MLNACIETGKTLKKPISKAHIRTEIEQQMADYVERGGAVSAIERGISGRDGAVGPLKPDNTNFQQPKVSRTYVPEVVAAIDAIRNKKAEPPKTARRRPYKKITYDDFGEAVRWEWVEE